MTNLIIDSKINVKAANRLILILLLLWFLPVIIHIPQESLLNKNISNSIQSYGTVLLIVLLLILFRPKAIREFVQDSRFKTVPRWHETLMVIGTNYIIIIGLLVFFLGLLNLFSLTIGEIYELSDTYNQAPYLPYNKITGTFDLFSGTVNFLAVVIIIPLYEELLYRGLALRAYEKARSPLFAAVLTAVLFSLFHLNVTQLIFLFPVSFIIARAVQVLGSWWIAVIFHVIHNGLIFFISSFTFANENITENPISLWLGLVGLLLAIAAFGIAMYWFKTCDQQTSVFDRNKKKEKVFTLSLNIFIVICFILMIQ
jgi:membrane protease YdiL (CAAX protease family)